jgi:hypothetical protein
MVEKVPLTGPFASWLLKNILERTLRNPFYTFDTSESIPNYRGGLGQDSLRFVYSVFLSRSTEKLEL